MPSSPGAYVVAHGSEVLYVGRSENLAYRWSRYEHIERHDCYYGGSSTTCRVNNLIGSLLIAGSELTLWMHLTTAPGPVEVAVYGECRPPWNLAWPVE